MVKGKDSKNKEDNDMQIVPKDKPYKKLSLSSKKMSEIVVHPKVNGGKVLLSKHDKNHRYIMDEEGKNK